MLKSKQKLGPWREEISYETWSPEGDAAIAWDPIERKRKRRTSTEFFFLSLSGLPEHLTG